VDAALLCDLRRAGRTDLLGDTINYAEVYKYYFLLVSSTKLLSNFTGLTTDCNSTTSTPNWTQIDETELNYTKQNKTKLN
jgi:hypothetical protein